MSSLQLDIVGLLRAVIDINARSVETNSRAVDIIARIEAGIPTSLTSVPQPAPFPGAQNEGPGKQGGDQRAQKSDAVAAASEAGAAQAAIKSADRRNSSRPAGEVASAPLPVDRTPDPDQPIQESDQAVSATADPICSPSVAAPPSETDGEQPLTKGEQVLRLWATTTLSQPEIARQVGCGASSVSAFVSMARKDGDPRASARVGVSAMQAPTVQPEPELEATPATPAPASQTQVVPAEPEPEVASPPAQPTHIVSFSKCGLKVHGPRGTWSTYSGIVRMLGVMNDGHIHSVDKLAKIGDYSSPALLSSRFGFIGEKLEDIGIKFTHIRGQGCKIELARP
ncbi:hypothetical protein DK26_23345 [Bosea sp. WAO]|uniref:hypothetical protein n=1 Tax=Bosea sp. WAO TaxID=406341 RepID=UPI00074600F0|nr:hypothetical protein [Bosea sp. WAO]KUL93457.1 hypothetical protein DK26_23345 [Bosea sp. WAO]